MMSDTGARDFRTWLFSFYFFPLGWVMMRFLGTIVRSGSFVSYACFWLACDD